MGGAAIIQQRFRFLEISCDTFFRENSRRAWLNKRLFSVVGASPRHGDGDSSFHANLVPGSSFRHTHAAGVSSSGLRSIPSRSSPAESEEGKKPSKLFGTRGSRLHTRALSGSKDWNGHSITQQPGQTHLQYTVCVHKPGDDDEGGRVKEMLVHTREEGERELCTQRPLY